MAAMQAGLWSGVAACAALAVASGVADRRRARRSDPDRVGVVPWTTLQLAALMTGIVVAAVAISG